MSVMPDVVMTVRPPPKDSDENEKPDDYDRVSRPLVIIKRVLFFFPRLIKSVLLALWRRLFGAREKP